MEGRLTACFSGWPMWEVMVDCVQQTTEEATCSERRRGHQGVLGSIGMDDGWRLLMTMAAAAAAAGGRDYYYFMVSSVVGGGR